MGGIHSDQTSESIAKLLIDNEVCRHGVKEVYEVTGIQKQSTTAYHPQADGLVGYVCIVQLNSTLI